MAFQTEILDLSLDYGNFPDLKRASIQIGQVATAEGPLLGVRVRISSANSLIYFKLPDNEIPRLIIALLPLIGVKPNRDPVSATEAPLDASDLAADSEYLSAPKNES